MDDETDSHIEPEIAEYPEAGPFWVGLWAVARHWVALLAHIFEPDVIAGPGVTRRVALRCLNWLWPIEGLVRRLIIAAAMKLDVSQLPQLIAGRKTPAGPRTSAASVAFAVLPRVPGRQPQRTPRAGRPAPEHRHIGFPGDALLLLFRGHDRRNARPLAARHSHPLHRCGRRSRWDPDYQGDTATAQERHDRRFFGPFRQHPDAACPRPAPRPHTRADRSSPYWKPPSGVSGGDLPEWKRLELEWDRVIPAPRIAGRIRALVRVLQAPERWIARAARRLGSDLLARIRELPPPRLRKPKLDRSPSGFLAEPLAEAHALIDTS